MTTSISPATSLATFSIPHASSSKLPHVTLNTVEVLSGKQGSQRLAVAAVQGDGVWTYDVSVLRRSVNRVTLRWSAAGIVWLETDLVVKYTAAYDILHRPPLDGFLHPSHQLRLIPGEGQAKESR